MHFHLVQHNTLVEQATGWTLREEPKSVIPEVPTTVRHLIEQQLTDIGPGDEALLEVASVVGGEFSAAEVAVGLGQTIEAIEVRCVALARHQQFVRPGSLDTWPDGTVTARYSFQHDG